MWKKIKQILGVQQNSDENEDEEHEFVNFTKKDPVDVQFTKNFISAGGKFFYAENEQETLQFLKELIDDQEIDKIVCFEKNLKSLLNRLNVSQSDHYDASIDFVFIKCEYLVAFDGSIMLSSDTTKGRKQEEMPVNILVFATPAQLVTNVSEALTKLKSAKRDDIPSNISSIRGKNLHDMQVDSAHKNIYLILSEVSQ